MSAPAKQRLTASALAAGETPCPFDAFDRCDYCGTYGPCHRDSRRVGGHSYSLVSFCHHVEGCEQRRGR